MKRIAACFLFSIIVQWIAACAWAELPVLRIHSDQQRYSLGPYIEALEDPEGKYTAGLTFTAFDWNLDRIVTITGQDDDIVDGNQAFTVRIKVDAALTTDTTGYASLNPSNLSLANIDDDIFYTVTASRI